MLHALALVTIGHAIATASAAASLPRHRAAALPALQLPLQQQRSSSSSRSVLALRGGAGLVRKVTDEADLENEIDAAGSKLVVIDFFAEWCGPCKRIAPVLEQLAKSAGSKVVFLKVDVDELKEFAAESGVKSMPTIQFFRNGVKVDQIVGADVAALRSKISSEMLPPLLRAIKGVGSNGAVLAGALLVYLVVPWDRYLAV